MAKNESALVKTDSTAVVKQDTALLLKTLGFEGEDAAGFEQTQSGGITRWLDLKSFQADPNAPQNKPVKGNGKAFAGILLGRQEIEVGDDESGEVNADGIKVRYSYSLKLMSPCPATYKDDGETIAVIAQPGEIISVGERFTLRKWRDLCENGGVYAVVVRPHSRIRVGGGHTMWTFDTFEKTLRPPINLRAELVAAKAPF